MDIEEPIKFSVDEPMDVDLSAHSTSVMDISYTSSNIDLSTVKAEPECADFNDSFDKPETINKLILCKMVNRNTLSITKSNIKKHGPIVVLSLILFFVSFVTYQTANCCENLDIEILKHNLMTKLYGQTVTIQHILKALDTKESRKIIIFYGGTGVGKTFTSSIMLENLLDHNNIYHYTMPSFLQTFSTEMMHGLIFCKSTFLVVDDLTSNDSLNVKVPIKELILKSERLSKNITMILIFNCDIVNENFVSKCDETFSSELRQSLGDLNAKKYFIKFESLTKEHLRNCIENELAYKKISAKNIDRIAKLFNVTLDGCKGVHQKLQYLNIM